jgi:hypothetical protein
MENSIKQKALGGVATLAVIAVVAFEFFVLRGEQIFNEQFYSSDSTKTYDLIIKQPNVKHRVQFNSRKAMKVEIVVLDPDGEEAGSFKNLVEGEGTRHFNFVPTEAGTYQITINRLQNIATIAKTGGRLRVFANDRRFIPNLPF